MNITSDANEYEVGTFGDGKLSEDFYKFRPIVTRIIFIEMMTEYIDDGHIVPPAFADLSESDKKENIIKFKECVECAKMYLKWPINNVSNFINQWYKCFPGFEKYLDEEVFENE